MSSSANSVNASPAVARTPEFLRVSELVPNDQDVLTIPVGTRVARALDVMRDREFDQLPVTTIDGRVLGVFTYRALARGLGHLRRQDDPLTTPVDDLLEEMHFVRPAQELSSILPLVEADNAVLVGDEDRVLAIVTAADISRYMWSRTRPFVLLQDIELGVRDLMRSCCTSADIAQLVAAARQGGTAVGTRFDDLTLGELLSVLLNGRNFGTFFHLSFGVNRDLVRTTLEPVRETRNKVFHFRGEVTSDELEALVGVATWLRRKILIRGGA